MNKGSLLRADRRIDYRLVERVFQAALEQVSDRRTQFVREQCVGDAELENEVLGLLAAFEQPAKVLETPVDRLYASLAAESVARILRAGEIDGFRVERLIGEGGMGAVFLAYDPELNRPVALKTLPFLGSKTEREIELFRREALATSAVSHPNVTHVYKFGQSDGLFYIAMEFVDGQSLREVIDGGISDLDFAIKTCLRLADVLDAVHAAGIVHRDIKPENVMLTRRGHLKVLDFGLAVDRSLNNGINVLPVGTAAYLPPEFFFGGELDHRTDLWSLGVILHEMLTGKRPFIGRNNTELIEAICTMDYRAPEISRGIPVLNSLIESLLIKNPEHRISNAKAVMQELRLARRVLLN